MIKSLTSFTKSYTHSAIKNEDGSCGTEHIIDTDDFRTCISNKDYSLNTSNCFLEKGDYLIVFSDNFEELNNFNYNGYRHFYQTEGELCISTPEEDMKDFIETEYILIDKNDKLMFISDILEDFTKENEKNIQLYVSLFIKL